VAATTRDDIDGLFQLPPGEFTAARNALAGQLKKAGRADDAERVKALPKPPLSAWAVNQLYWKHRKAFDRLIAAGARFRDAQAAQLAGKAADLRRTLQDRREALAELTKIAVGVLRHAGNSASPEMTRRITTTLDALATYGSHADAPPAGRLTDDIDPPGFEALAALVPQPASGKRSGGAPPRIIPFEQKPRQPRQGRTKLSPEEAARQREQAHKAEVAAARAGVAEAERAVRDARRAAERAEAALKKAAARAKDAEREKDAIERQLEQAAAAFEAARQQARQVASEAEDAAQAVADAERALEKATKTLATLVNGES
jgi:hypothetical protein